MEINRENTNGDETTTPVAPLIGGEDIYGWSEKFQCKTTNGILAPTPLSSIPLEEEEEEHDQPEPSKKKQRKTEGDGEFFFRLFKFQNVDDQYLLERHGIRSGRIDRYHLFAKLESGNWTVEVCDLAPDTYTVFPVLCDPFVLRPPPNHNLSMQDRLRGWTVEKRKRANGKFDKFYYHGGRQFRSFVEVTLFILYTTKSIEELKAVIRNPDPVDEAQLI